MLAVPVLVEFKVIVQVEVPAVSLFPRVHGLPSKLTPDATPISLNVTLPVGDSRLPAGVESSTLAVHVVVSFTRTDAGWQSTLVIVGIKFGIEVDDSIRGAELR